MNFYLVSPLIIVCSVILYHFAQKSIPNDASPWVILSSAYCMAFALCVTLLIATSEIRKSAELFKTQNLLLAILLAIAAVGVEFGYLYAYRAGWKISTLAITTGPFVNIALLLIGVLWFKEKLSLTNLIGMMFCIIGTICLNQK